MVSTYRRLMLGVVAMTALLAACVSAGGSAETGEGLGDDALDAQDLWSGAFEIDTGAEPLVRGLPVGLAELDDPVGGLLVVGGPMSRDVWCFALPDGSADAESFPSEPTARTPVGWSTDLGYWHGHVLVALLHEYGIVALSADGCNPVGHLPLDLPNGVAYLQRMAVVGDYAVLSVEVDGDLWGLRVSLRSGEHEYLPLGARGSGILCADGDLAYLSDLETLYAMDIDMFEVVGQVSLPEPIGGMDCADGVVATSTYWSGRVEIFDGTTLDRLWSATWESEAGGRDLRLLGSDELIVIDSRGFVLRCTSASDACEAGPSFGRDAREFAWSTDKRFGVMTLYGDANSAGLAVFNSDLELMARVRPPGFPRGVVIVPAAP